VQDEHGLSRKLKMNSNAKSKCEWNGETGSNLPRKRFQDKQRKSEFQEPASCPIGICPFFCLRKASFAGLAVFGFCRLLYWIGLPFLL